MKRAQRCLLSILGIMFMSLLITASYAWAEVKEGNLFYNEEMQSIQVSISYEHNDAKISIVSPSGRIISPEEDSEDVTVFSTDAGLYIIIKDAEQGQWVLNYDKGSNDSISASVDKYETPIWITQFDILSIENDLLICEFLADHMEDTSYNYTISLATENEGGSTRELKNGYGRANEIVSASIDISDVNTYDGYYLQLNINYFKSDLEYFDIAYSEPFKYVNSKFVEPLKGLDVTVYPEYNNININWAEHIPHGTKQLYVIVEADGNEIYSAPYNPQEYDEFTLQYEEEVKAVELGITIQDSYGIISEPFYKTVGVEKGDNDFQLSFPQQLLTNSYQWAFGYRNAVNQQIDITINEKVQSLVLEGSGDKYFILDGENNNLIIAYVDSQGTGYEYQLIANVDSIPPQLKIFENLDGSNTTNDSVVVTGKTDVGAIITINDTLVEIDEGGMFIHTQPLILGPNDIIIASVDEVGNITSYTGSVLRNDEKVEQVAVTSDKNISEEKTSFVKKYFPWIIAAMILLVVIIVVILIIIIRRKKQKADKPKEKSALKRLFILSLCLGIPTAIIGVAGIVYYLVRRNFEKSEKYVREAYESVGEAYDYILLTQKIKDISIIILIVAGVLIILALIFKLVLKIVKHIREPKHKDNEKLKNTTDLPVTNDEPIEQEPSLGEGQIKYCTMCGTSMDLHDKFCENCGAKLTE